MSLNCSFFFSQNFNLKFIVARLLQRAPARQGWEAARSRVSGKEKPAKISHLLEENFVRLLFQKMKEIFAGFARRTAPPTKWLSKSRKVLSWCPRQESNLYFKLRKLASYPLNDEGVFAYNPMSIPSLSTKLISCRTSGRY